MEIKFVSYTGAYPTLCMGVLTLEIDGTIYHFGGCGKKDETHLDSFWESGGKVWFSKDWEDHVKQRKWKLVKEALPEFLRPYGKRLIRIFNKNVRYGCCGGCIQWQKSILKN